MSMNNGGPAFPVECYYKAGGYGEGVQTSTATGWSAGLSIRDYAAIHSVQPGCGEIASMAGLTYSCGQVWSDESTSLGPFDTWFTQLPLDRRLDLFAAVKYAMADAMIRARPTTQQPEPTEGRL